MGSARESGSRKSLSAILEKCSLRCNCLRQSTLENMVTSQEVGLGALPLSMYSTAMLLFNCKLDHTARTCINGDSDGTDRGRPSQAKVLTEGGDLREAQVDIPLSVIHTCVWAHCWTRTDTFTLTGGYANANGIESLKTKRRPLYLKTQSVPRCKHFSSRL